MAALQLYTAPRQLEPLPLNPTAVQLNQRGTNFLAFNRRLSSEPAVEFATGESQAGLAGAGPTWPGVWPGGLKVRDTDPELRHSFAKPGIFGFRYKDVANPIAYGSDYNIDFGPGKPGPGVVAAERANGIPVDPTMLDPMPPPAPRQMIFTEKSTGMLPDPANAYATYGYKETAEWLPGANRAARRMEKTRVMDMDSNQCAPGDSQVNGFCMPSNNARVSCPPGWTYGPDGQCHRNPQVVHERANGAALEGITRKDCPPGWKMQNGVCVSGAEHAQADPLQYIRKIRTLKK